MKFLSDDREYIKSRKDDIFQILLEAYENIGSCDIYRNPKHMIQSVGRYKLIIDDAGDIYAAATYRIMPNTLNYKCTLIGADKHLGPEAKMGVVYIIKSDIVNFQHLYWIEASGPIAHWEEKYGAYKIPAVYVPSILNMMSDDIEFIPNEEYQYSRMIKGLDEPQIKTMFGFSSKEMIDEMISKEGYERYVKNIQRILGGVYDLLRERYNKFVSKREFENITKVMEYIVDANNVQHDFCNVTEKCYDLMYYVLQKAEYILRYNRHLMNDRQRSAFHSLYYDYKIIYLEASVIEPTQLF